MSFYTILTAIGKAKIANAQVTGTSVNLTHMAIGDGNGNYYEPQESQTALVHETWRGNINRIVTDETNPNWIIIEVVIPTTAGGFTVREAGVFDEDGDMIAVGKYPETYKPTLAEGAGKDLYVRMILEVTNVSTVTLKIDPTVVLASRAYVDQEILTVQQQIANHTGNADIHVTRNASGELVENITGFAQRSKIDEIRLLGTWPHLAKKLSNQFLTLDVGDDTGTAMAYDGVYIYILLQPGGGENAKIVKIDPVTFTKVGSTLTLPDGNTAPVNMIYDGTYLYIWMATSPAKIAKIDPRTMQKVGATLTLDSGENSGFGSIMAFDGTYIYGMCSVLSTNPIIKINPNGSEDMIRVDAYIHSEIGNWQGQALAFDGKYLYSALSYSGQPSKIIKIDPTTMTKIGNTLTLDTNDQDIRKMIFDGAFLYALGCQGTSNTSEVIKIDPGTMTKVGSTLRITYENYITPVSGAFDGRYLYIGHNVGGVPIQGPLAKVDTFSMTQVGKVVLPPVGFSSNCGDIIMDGNYIYFVSFEKPARVWKRDLYSAFN